MARPALSLPADELHVWHASLERPAGELGELRRLLSSDERARAERLRFDAHRSRFIAGRALLRTLLGRYLATPPSALRFEYGEFGKPRLAGDGPAFNVSHSGALALFAFSAGADVGVDIELHDRDHYNERIAERFFSASEVAVLRSLPVELRPTAFLSCWTRKEAFIKARGDGLSLALDSFDVSLGPDKPAALLRTAWSSEDPLRWRMADLSDADAGYAAAVAIRSVGWRLVRCRIPDTIDDERGSR